VEYVVAVLVGFGLSQVAGLITTMYLHRTLSHKALKLSPVVTMLMRVGTWMFTIVSPREWVAVHRKHHNFSDVEGDPHSPHIEGYWQIMIANVYYYKREARNGDTLEKYAADLPHDRLDKFLFKYPELGYVVTGALLVLLMGVGPGLVAFAVHTVVYVTLNAAVNGAGHTFGYKSFANDATNLKLLALVTFGEGLHNNHHARPAAPKLSAFRGEVDPAWPIIRLLEKLRLVKVLTRADEGWEDHRRRIPKTTLSPLGTVTVRAAAKD
jgi:stearoyl-CoA desaturase (delta-9 desaturase)